MNSIKFWKENTALRAILMAATFILGLVLLVYGWKQPGTISGLVIMLVGVASLLVTLWLYNKPYTDPPRGTGKK